MRKFAELLNKTGEIRLTAFFEKGQDDKGRKALYSEAIIRQWEREGRGVYMVIGDGGYKRTEITRCPALFVEWDDKPPDWQRTAWRELGLPEPTLQVDTAGKSIHNYWVLTEAIEPARFRDLQARLAAACGSDPALKNENRIMRLPGVRRGDRTVELIKDDGPRVDVEVIESWLPAPKPPPVLATSRRQGPDTRTIDDIRAALATVPRRVGGEGSYPEYRNLLWGLGHALKEIGRDPSEAITLMEEHSPSGTECGWDVRQVFESGGSEVTAASFWGQCKQVAKPPALAQPQAPDRKQPFKMLGFDTADGYYYLPKASCKVERLSRAQHTTTNLVCLAPVEWWQTVYPNEKRTAVDWTSAASALFAQQHEIGIFNPDLLRGRGAWIDNGKPVLHLGDRLVISGVAHDIADKPDTEYLYPRSAPMCGCGGAEPLSDEEGLRLLQISSMFRWERQVNGFLQAGWIALAPICGIIQWRPHIWVTASAAAGKSTLIEQFVNPLLGEWGLYVQGGQTTEPAIRQMLGAQVSDARPLLMDEAEANTENDSRRMESIMTLIRGASSDTHAVVAKGSSSGVAQVFRVRTMCMLVSIATSIQHGADHRRFSVLQLLNPNRWPSDEAAAHWQTLQRELEWVDRPLSKRIMARMVELLPQVKGTIDVFRVAGRKKFGMQALADQLGTLMAGAYLLQSRQVPTSEQAMGFLNDQDWEAHAMASEDTDEMRCLDAIMQQRVQLDMGRYRTVRELVDLVRRGDPNEEEYICALGRAGVKVEADRLMISNNCATIRANLSKTPWTDSWPDQLARLLGAIRPGKTRFKCIGTHRCVSIPIDLLL